MAHFIDPDAGAAYRLCSHMLQNVPSERYGEHAEGTELDRRSWTQCSGTSEREYGHAGKYGYSYWSSSRKVSVLGR